MEKKILKTYNIRKGEEVKKIYRNGIRIDLADSEDVYDLPKGVLGVYAEKGDKIVIESETRIKI